jgi:hypothetical protein
MHINYVCKNKSGETYIFPGSLLINKGEESTGLFSVYPQVKDKKIYLINQIDGNEFELVRTENDTYSSEGRMYGGTCYSESHTEEIINK